MFGTVIKAVSERGYLFLKDDDGRTRFIHASSFVIPLEYHEATEGVRLEFTPVDNSERGNEKSNKLRGIEVRIANDD